MNTSIRIYTKEQLDNLSLSGTSLIDTLKSLRKINAWFGNHRQLRKAVQAYCTQHSSQTSFHIIDLGCGSGDSLVHCIQALQAKGIKATGMGIDGNPETIAYAKKCNPIPNAVEYRTANILEDTFCLPEGDLLISSHFIYHFTEKQAHSFFQKIEKSSIQQVIFSELRRSALAYLLFWSFGKIAPITTMAKQDGLLALQRTFTIDELEMLFRNYGFRQYRIQKKPWFRMLATLTIPRHSN